jgi:hypothetical protein
MATRSRTTFKKRQKELARLEKQRDKAARKAARKLAPPEPDIDQLEQVDQLDQVDQEDGTEHPEGAEAAGAPEPGETDASSSANR